ncbi:MAG: hypothetical protein ACFFCD_04790 [Promethearchaeota archaeon]
MMIDQDLKKKIEELKITETEIETVIESAEETGNKLYQPGKEIYLVKGYVGKDEAKRTLNVVYSVDGGNYKVHSVYAHKARFMK